MPSPQCTFGCWTLERFSTTLQSATTSASPLRSVKLPSGHARFVAPRLRYWPNRASEPRPIPKPTPPLMSDVLPSFLKFLPGRYWPALTFRKGANAPSFMTRFTTPAIASDPYWVDAPSRSTSRRSIALDGNALRSTPLEPGADPFEKTFMSDV